MTAQEALSPESRTSGAPDPQLASRRIGRDALFYGLSGALSRVASVFMLPIYTRHLDPAAYGVLQLLELAAELTYILFTAGTRSGLLRLFYAEEDLRARHAVVSTTFVLEMCLAAAGAILLYAAAVPVWRIALGNEGSVSLVQLAALNFFLLTSSYTPLAYLQARRRAKSFAAAQAAKLVLQIAFNLYFLVYLDLGVTGMMLSAIVVNGLFGLALVTWMLLDTGLRFSPHVARQLRSYGVPYQFSTAGGFILTFGDRFFLQRFSGASAVGLYSLAYQFGFLLYQVTAGPFLRAWEPHRFQAAAPQAQMAESDNAESFFLFNLALFSVGTALSVGARPAISLLTTAPFHSAAALVPLVVLTYIVHAWVEATKFGIDASGHTGRFTRATAVSVLVVLVSYAVLIPPLGGLGAVLATLLAFVVRLVITYRDSQRLFPLDYGWSDVRRLFLVSALTVSLSTSFAPSAVASQLALAFGAFLIYAWLAWRFAVCAERRDRYLRQLLNAVRSTRSRASGGRIRFLG